MKKPKLTPTQEALADIAYQLRRVVERLDILAAIHVAAVPDRDNHILVESALDAHATLDAQFRMFLGQDEGEGEGDE